jgi:four helix bundle protein
MITKDRILYDKAFSFAIRSVKLCRFLMEEKREYILSKQLLRSGTSIGANVAEANGAISSADFSTKVSIAYKESLETKYWLGLLKETDYLSAKAFSSLHQDADELSKILYSILRTTRLSSQHH